MTMCRAVHGKAGEHTFFVDDDCHPQTIAVVKTRAEPLGIEVVVGDHRPSTSPARGLRRARAVPGTDGASSTTPTSRAVHAPGALVVAPPTCSRSRC
jgi:glycine dehydrogenase